MEYKLGTVLPGGWKIVRVIGKGAYGRVFEVQKESHGSRPVVSALKWIRIPASDDDLRGAYSDGMDDKSASRFFQQLKAEIEREIGIMAELKDHPGIVRCEDFDVIDYPGEVHWDVLIRMELLTPLVDYAHARGGLTLAEVLRLGIQIGDALAYCHRRQLLHRDVKPENIFVDKLGHFKLGDFGIARSMEKTTTALTSVGTVSYMAPEIYHGLKHYDQTVDIYSLGLMLYRYLNNNRMPFMPSGELSPGDHSTANMRRMTGERIPPIAGEDDRLNAIILKACAFKAADRYRRADELSKALRSYAAERNIDWEEDWTPGDEETGTVRLYEPGADTGTIYEPGAEPDAAENYGSVHNSGISPAGDAACGSGYKTVYPSGAIYEPDGGSVPNDSSAPAQGSAVVSAPDSGLDSGYNSVYPSGNIAERDADSANSEHPASVIGTGGISMSDEGSGSVWHSVHHSGKINESDNGSYSGARSEPVQSSGGIYMSDGSSDSGYGSVHLSGKTAEPDTDSADSDYFASLIGAGGIPMPDSDSGSVWHSVHHSGNTAESDTGSYSGARSEPVHNSGGISMSDEGSDSGYESVHLSGKAAEPDADSANSDYFASLIGEGGIPMPDSDSGSVWHSVHHSGKINKPEADPAISDYLASFISSASDSMSDADSGNDPVRPPGMINEPDSVPGESGSSDSVQSTGEVHTPDSDADADADLSHNTAHHSEEANEQDAESGIGDSTGPAQSSDGVSESDLSPDSGNSSLHPSGMIDEPDSAPGESGSSDSVQSTGEVHTPDSDADADADLSHNTAHPSEEVNEQCADSGIGDSTGPAQSSGGIDTPDSDADADSSQNASHTSGKANEQCAESAGGDHPASTDSSDGSHSSDIASGFYHYSYKSEGSSASGHQSQPGAYGESKTPHSAGYGTGSSQSYASGYANNTGHAEASPGSSGSGAREGTGGHRHGLALGWKIVIIVAALMLIFGAAAFVMFFPITTPSKHIGSGVSATPTPAVETYFGDVGDNVTRLQARLYELGYLSEEQQDGVYGSDTVTAVRIFQQRAGLPVNGNVADGSTQAALFADDAPRAPGHEPCHFNEPAIEAAVREALGKPTGEIYGFELAEVDTLDLYGEGITDIGDLSVLTNLAALDLSDNSISDISPLSGLTKLNTLILSNNSIDDISPLSALMRLSYLDLRNNQITDYSPLDNLPWLAILKTDGNPVSIDASHAPTTAPTSPPAREVTFDDMIYDLHDRSRYNTSYPDQVKRIQQPLVDLGFLDDKVDGSYGAKTEQAVFDFQKHNGFSSPSGIATEITQYLLITGQCRARREEPLSFDPSRGNSVIIEDVSYEFVDGEIQPELTVRNTSSVEVVAVNFNYYFVDGPGSQNKIRGLWTENRITPLVEGVSSVLRLRPTGVPTYGGLRVYISEVCYADGQVWHDFDGYAQYASSGSRNYENKFTYYPLRNRD